MQASSEKNIVLAKLEDGERLIPHIQDLAEEQGIGSGVILSGIGMLRETTLNYFDGKHYVARQYPKPLELVSLHGSIAVDSSVHLHATLANRDTRVVGGHVSLATVHNFVELTLLRLDKIRIGRERNPDTGLAEFSLGPGPVSVDVSEKE